MDAISTRIARVVARVVRWSVIESTRLDEDPYPHQRVSYLGKEGEAQTWYPYGYNALAPRGSLALMWALAGDSNAYVAMPGSPQQRVKVLEGEVVMYHPLTGSKVHFKQDGSIDIESALAINVNGGADVNVTADNILITGETKVEGFTTMNNVHVLGTLVVEGNSDFQAALTVDPAGTPSGTNIDLREHTHEYHDDGPTFLTTGPEDP